MFVEHKEQGEAVPVRVGTLKLSEAIRMGKPMVGEEGCSFRLCAIGCAWAAVKGRLFDIPDAVRLHGLYPREFMTHAGIAILKDLGFPEDLAISVSEKHSSGMPALRIADWLETQGF